MAAPGSSSWLTGCLRRHLPAGIAADPVSLRESLEGRLTDTRKPRGKRHPLASLVSVAAAGLAAACPGPLAVAQAAAGWDQEVLAAHGCWISPRTGKRAAPSASMLDRLPKLLDPDELEAALPAAVAAAALDPAVPAAYAGHREQRRREQEEKQKKRKRKPPAAESFREEREDGWFRPHLAHPWLDPDLRKLAVQNGQVFRRAANLPFEGSFPIWPRSTKFFAVEYLWWKNLDVTYW